MDEGLLLFQVEMDIYFQNFFILILLSECLLQNPIIFSTVGIYSSSAVSTRAGMETMHTKSILYFHSRRMNEAVGKIRVMLILSEGIQ